MLFIENVGQLDGAARFQVRGGHGTAFLAEDAVWLTLSAPSQPAVAPRSVSSIREPGGAQLQDGPRRGVNLKLTFPGAEPHPHLEPFNRLDTHVSYFVGSDPAKWRRDVPVWGGVRYKDLYPGIDLEISGQSGRWSWRMVARDRADPGVVRLQVAGAESVSLEHGAEAQGNAALRLATPVGDFALSLPQVFDGDGRPIPLSVHGTVEGNDLVAPFVAPFGRAGTSLDGRASGDPSATVTGAFDLLYATFLGGSGGEGGNRSPTPVGVALDAWGNAYVTNGTLSEDFPTTPGAFDRSSNSRFLSDVVVAKLNASGGRLLYATFIGGSAMEQSTGIAVNPAGNAYVVGWTESSDFPTTPGALNRSHANSPYPTDVFVVKLSDTGSTLLYGTYIGAWDIDEATGIAVDGSGNAFVTGWTMSERFPTTEGAFQVACSRNDAFVVKLNATGSALAYSTCLNGPRGFSRGRGIAVDQWGNAYVTGETTSASFPTTPGAFDTDYNGGGWNYGDAFVAKLNPGGNALVYSTYLGGAGSDSGYGIAVDSSGNAYVTGPTSSENFPTTAGAFDGSLNGGEVNAGDAFVARLNASGSALSYATFLGGSSEDRGHGIAVDGLGNAYVTGSTWSSNFPTTAGAFDPSFNGSVDAFLVKLNPDGRGLAYAAFLAGTGLDSGSGIAVDESGNAFVAGFTDSSDFPTTPGAFKTSLDLRDTDIFVVKIATTPVYAISGRVADRNGSPVPGAAVLAGAAYSAAIDGTGAYTLHAPAGRYDLKAQRTCSTFSPTSRAITVPPAATGQDFAGSPMDCVRLPLVLKSSSY